MNMSDAHAIIREEKENMIERYATIKGGTVAGIVNHDGDDDHLYGDVEFMGPLADSMGLEWVGRSAKELAAALDHAKPTMGERVGEALERGAHAVAKALGPNDDELVSRQQEYRDLTKTEPDKRWKLARLMKEIDEAKARQPVV